MRSETIRYRTPQTRGKTLLKWGVVLAIFATVFGGCAGFMFSPIHEYAVDREAVQLECRTYYYADRDKRYDFDTVLYTAQDCAQPCVNFPPPTIYISHLAFPIPADRDNRGKLVSTLYFEVNAFPPGTQPQHVVEVLTESIRLSHRTESGIVIRPDATVVRATAFGIEYEQTYPRSGPLSDRLIENIHFEIVVDGKRLTVEREYSIVRAPHYTPFDVLSSV
jgi:hypothetical protein